MFNGIFGRGIAVEQVVAISSAAAVEMATACGGDSGLESGR